MQTVKHIWFAERLLYKLEYLVEGFSVLFAYGIALFGIARGNDEGVVCFLGLAQKFGYRLFVAYA